MKNNSFLFVFTVLFTIQVSAQTTPTKEIGLQMSGIDFDGFNGFSAFYKKQLSENVWRRYTFTSNSLLVARYGEGQNAFGLAAGIGIGREKRKWLNDNLQVYRGRQWRFGAQFSDNSTSTANFSARVGFDVVLGIQHHINKYWAINLEATPGVSLNSNISEARFNAQLNAEFNNRVSIGLIRKF